MRKRSRNGEGKRLRTGDGARKVRPPAIALRAAAPKKRASKELPVLITGGAGFIGTNLAHHYLASGQPVVLYDNLSRPGVEPISRGCARRTGSLSRWRLPMSRISSSCDGLSGA